MYLCHRAVYTPVGAKGTPAADELLFGFGKFHAAKLWREFCNFKNY